MRVLCVHLVLYYKCFNQVDKKINEIIGYLLESLKKMRAMPLFGRTGLSK